MAQGSVLKKVWTPPALVSTLPTSPYDGQEVYYLADAANSRIWHLRYNAGSASIYKWEYLGGSPMRALRNPASTNDPYNSGSYGDPATAGPSLTLPLAGDYSISLHWDGSHSSAGGYGVCAVKIGSGATADAQGVFGQTGIAGGNWTGTSTFEATVTPAGTIIKCQYRSGSGATMTIHNPVTNPNWLEARPVRVA